jgi:hypothetical protein
VLHKVQVAEKEKKNYTVTEKMNFTVVTTSAAILAQGDIHYSLNSKSA